MFLGLQPHPQKVGTDIPKSPQSLSWSTSGWILPAVNAEVGIEWDQDVMLSIVCTLQCSGFASLPPSLRSQLRWEMQVMATFGTGDAHCVRPAIATTSHTRSPPAATDHDK